MSRLHDEFDRILHEFGMPFWSAPNGKTARAPSVDIYEKDGTLFVEAELPGIAKEDVRVTCQDHSVVIQGETREEKKEEKDGYYRSERRVGHFYRAVPLPAEVQFDQATAEFKDGVLKVALPKATPAAAEERTIPIAS